MPKPFILSVIKHILPRVRAELLRLLFTDPERSLHLRDLARLSGLAVGTIQREIANLRVADLVIERRDGNRLYFKANIANPIFPELQSIALKTMGLGPQLMKVLARPEAPTQTTSTAAASNAIPSNTTWLAAPAPRKPRNSSSSATN